MKRSVLLLFGGESSEHDVSIMSAKNVHAALNKDKYDVHLCYIEKTGTRWQYVSSFEQLNGANIQFNIGTNKIAVGEQEQLIDVIFPVLHGAHGEDGDVQGLARLLHVPCVGPNVAGAAITMDKDVTKRLLRLANIPVVDWITWHSHSPRPTYDEARTQLGERLFVKPSRAGSSVGVSKVVDESSFEAALSEAQKHDTIVIVESAVSGREIEVAALGNDNVRISTPGEIIPGEEFYSYEDKYADSSTSQVRIPAELDQHTVTTITDLATQAYSLTRGQGMARIDFFICDEKVYLNEINSIPGFTNISMYPKLWEHQGISQTELVDLLIEHACKI